MCGFVGFTNQIGDDGIILSSMMDTIIHRGPDSSGKYVDENVALGFRRLSIIGLEDGNQPMKITRLLTKTEIWYLYSTVKYTTTLI